MKQKTRCLVVSFVIVAMFELRLEATWPAEKLGKLTRVRIGYVSRSTLDMPFMIARERGFFHEEGLDAEFIFMKAIQTVQVMLAGGIDFGTATGTAISAAVNGLTFGWFLP